MNTIASERRIRNNRIRRRRELRRHILTCFLMLIITIGSSLLFFSFRAKAQSNDEEIMYKYYKSTVVSAGDTLWDFAEEYGMNKYYDGHQEYIREVMQMNGLSDDRITEGQYLILPYYSPEYKS